MIVNHPTTWTIVSLVFLYFGDKLASKVKYDFPIQRYPLISKHASTLMKN
jgi:hypothetical protein